MLEESASRQVPSLLFCRPASAFPLVFSLPLPLNHHSWLPSLWLQAHWKIGEALPLLEPSASRHVPDPTLRRMGRLPTLYSTVHCWKLSLALHAHWKILPPLPMFEASASRQ